MAFTSTKIGKLTPAAILHGVRTTLAAAVSMLLARWLGLPEFYWAPISAIVIIESTINPRTVAWQRFVGTALGAMLGGLIASFFSSNALVYVIAIFLSGAICVVLRLRGAHRFAAITVTIILLVPHQHRAWIVAGHRFVEVSLGIAVALALALLWPIRVPDAG